MVFKLLQAAECRWWAVNGPNLVALVRAGARFDRCEVGQTAARVAPSHAAPADGQPDKEVISRTPTPKGAA
jgi:putative transposase